MNEAEHTVEFLRRTRDVFLMDGMTAFAGQAEVAADLIERQSAEIERLHTERRRLLRQIGTE